MIAYVLNNNIDSQKLIRDIQELINKTLSNDPNQNGHILKIEIKPISRDDTAMIPKLEFKESTEPNS